MSPLPCPADPELAAADLHARSNPRDPAAAPHHVRCNEVAEGKRCLLSIPHSGEHAFRKDEP